MGDLGPMGQLAQTFGKQIKAMRAERRMSQAQLADLADVSEEWVRRIERGEGSPSLDTVEALARSLGATVATLFGGHPDAPAISPTLVRLLGALDDEELAWIESAAKLAASRPR